MDSEADEPVDDAPVQMDTQEALLIVNMRIYDALMATLTHINPTYAQDLMERHTRGEFVGFPPFIGENPFPNYE